MSTTLTNGLKLPDKGSVDWYADMQSNYAILDGAVGTVAEHTSQIAGKAPAVHTHTKADITDFPALANVATSGSYSDLNNIPATFTPSSHVHGNLTNDGTLGTTQGKPVITGIRGILSTGSFGTTAGTFCEGNDSRLSDARTPVAHTHTKSDVTDLLNSNFIPSANNSYDLGSNSYQWNNLYANSYFLKSASAELGITGGFSTIKFQDKNNKNLAGITLGHYSAGKLSYNRFSIYDKDSNNQELEEFVELAFLVSNQVFYFRPSTDNKAYLGTSGKKWKDLCTNLINGTDPGALSLPKSNTSVTAISVSGFSFDGSNENVPDTVNLFSNGEALVDGWLCARLKEGVGHYIFLNSDGNTNKIGIMTSCFSPGVVSTIAYGINVYVPVKAGDKPIIRWAKPDGGGAQLLFYPCLGNV